MGGEPEKSEPIFHRGDGLGVADFKKSWATATKAAKCSGKLFHDLRRTVARRLLAAGVPMPVCMRLTGHETNEMFTRYALAGEAELLLEAQRKVAEFRRKSA